MSVHYLTRMAQSSSLNQKGAKSHSFVAGLHLAALMHGNQRWCRVICRHAGATALAAQIPGAQARHDMQCLSAMWRTVTSPH